MKKKIRVGILFGGRSAEHEVSIQSAKNVYEALDAGKHEPVMIGITKKGGWLRLPDTSFKQIISQSYQPLPETGLTVSQPSDSVQQSNLDVVFPILHGPYGEDGTVQGLLKLMGIPYVGADVLGSAVGMDKDVMKRLLRDAGLPIVQFLAIQNHEKEKFTFDMVVKKLGLPFFVKPANLGSSVGVSKVTTELEFEKAVGNAFLFDRKILLEEGINAREIECSVLGNEDKRASLPGEVIPHHEFYDYEAKYIDENGAGLDIPAKLSPKQVKEIQELAIKACTVLCVEGMARVDFFLEKETGKIYLNEINTIPGFTNISMYPKLWEASGISYKELIGRLIRLAIERHSKEQQLQTSR